MPFFDPKGFKTVTKYCRKIMETVGKKSLRFLMCTKNIHKNLPNNNKTHVKKLYKQLKKIKKM